MGCDCDKKPELPKADKCGDMTPAVLEVKNPSEIIMFHKVIIPANMGDESDYPALNGLYKNVLMVYAANGHAYLYSSDGIPTYISFDTGGVLTVDTLPDPSAATRGFLYVTEAGSMYVTLDNESWITLSTGTNPEFDTLSNRPKYAGTEMTSATNIPSVEQLRSDMETLFAEEIAARTNADTTLQNNINAETTARQDAISILQNNLTAEATARSNGDATIQTEVTGIENAINKDVMTDIAVDPNASTTVVQLDATKTNIKTSATATTSVPLPVASNTQAGVMNAATYQAITDNTTNINALVNGAVAITGLPATPTQAQLTTAWENATGLTTLMNRAGIYDVTNEKVWTYYTNDTTWHAASNSTQVTVNPFTNSQAGIILGSTNVGQVFAENDGTGSVNGWDTLSAQVSTNTSKLSSIEAGAEVNVQSDWNEADSTADDYIKNKPAINDATLTIQENGTNVATFTANSASNATANITVPTATSELTNDSNFVASTGLKTVNGNSIVGSGDVAVGDIYEGSVLSPTSAVEFVGTDNIQDGAVTSSKIDWATMGDQSSYLELGNILICWGVTGNMYVAGNSSANHTQSLPASFTNTSYTVLTTMNTRVNSFDNVAWAIDGKAASAFTINFYNHSSYAADGFQMNWMAIGVKASS